MPTLAEERRASSSGAIGSSGALDSNNGRRGRGSSRAVVASRAPLAARANGSEKAALVGGRPGDRFNQGERGRCESKRDENEILH